MSESLRQKASNNPSNPFLHTHAYLAYLGEVTRAEKKKKKENHIHSDEITVICVKSTQQ